MIRLTVIYGPPTDPASFDSYYAETHCKLVEKMPLVRQFSFSRGPVVSSDASRPAHLVAFLDYESKANLDESLGSDAGKAAVADVANFATGGVTILTAEI